jgi:hypothetical protein
MPLTPSQRIKILREVSNQLADSEWPEIDLVLTQFQLPTENTWNGSKVQYVLEMASNAPDEVLNGLAEHFELPAAVTGAPAVSHPSFWKEGTLKVFVTHLAIHRNFAGELQEQLMKKVVFQRLSHTMISSPQLSGRPKSKKLSRHVTHLSPFSIPTSTKATGLTRKSALPWGAASPFSRFDSVKTPMVLSVDSKHSTALAKPYPRLRKSFSMHTANTSKHRQ